MTDFLIRSAAEDDFPSVLPLFRQLWPDKQIDEAALAKVFYRGITSDADELLCAVVNGAVVGFCAYAIVNNFWQEGSIAYIYAMVVDECHRGEGCGTQLIRASMETARRYGLKRIELDSGFPRLQAHSFYEKLGFEKRAYLFSYRLS